MDNVCAKFDGDIDNWLGLYQFIMLSYQKYIIIFI